MTPEAKIKAKIKRRLERLSKECGLPLMWDTPPASEYGTGGRPDHMVILGTFMFFIEAKATKRRATEKQLAFHAKLKSHGFHCFVVAGDDGVDQLYADVKELILAEMTEAAFVRRMNHMKKILISADTLAKQPIRKQVSLDI